MRREKKHFQRCSECGNPKPWDGHRVCQRCRDASWDVVKKFVRFPPLSYRKRRPWTEK